VIEFEDAGFGYGGRTVLGGLNLEIATGTFSFLVGPSGAGKTTFLRLCYRDLVPTEGEVRLFGRSYARSSRNAIADLRRAVGVVHQECSFIDHLPLLANIALPLQVCGIGMAERADDLKALLDWVDLGGRVEALPTELSGGERQRAAVARAVILSPAMVLADEPTGNLDRDMAERVLGLFIELNRMGKTIVIATHDAALVEAAAGRVAAQVLALDEGVIVPVEMAA
jgi:cell division transport system ATP-binding protein